MYSSINTAFLHSINSNEVINNLLDIGITHIISFTPTHNKEIIEKFFYLNLLGTNILNNNENNNNKYNNILDINFNNNYQNKNLTSPFGYIYSTLDFLRHAMIYKGKVLFVDDYFYTNIPNKPNFFIRSIILIIFSYLLNQSAYDTYTFLNSKLLYFTIPLTYYLPQISNWVTNQNLIINYISSFPIYRCFCGACNLILKREYSPKLIKKCNCQKGHSSQQYSECPSNGCNEYIEKVKKYYNINYDNLIWSYADYNNDFFIFENNNLFNKKITEDTKKKILENNIPLEKQIIKERNKEEEKVKKKLLGSAQKQKKINKKENMSNKKRVIKVRGDEGFLKQTEKARISSVKTESENLDFDFDDYSKCREIVFKIRLNQDEYKLLLKEKKNKGHVSPYLFK
jgi:hypothetical protein